MTNTPKTFSDNLYRNIYVLSAIAALIVVFAGFARSYFLKGIYSPTVQLTTLVHFHGFVMTLWFSLFLVQSFLIRKHNVALHRRVGILGGVVAMTIILVGPITAITAFRLHGEGVPPKLINVPLFEIVAFGIFVSMGLLMRHRNDFHKRFITLATLGSLTSAIVRIPLDFIEKGSVPLAFGLEDLLILSVVVLDTTKNRRLHPVYGWGTLLLVTLQVSRLLIMDTPQWGSIANWLVH